MIYKEDTMNIDSILKLVEAGFSKEEITAMTQPAQAQEEPKQDEPKTEPVKEEPVKEEPAQDKRYEELLSAMNRLTGAIQAGNILNSNNKEVKEPSAEDILAEVLSPSKGGK
jgi:hypothetical protein